MPRGGWLTIATRLDGRPRRRRSRRYGLRHPERIHRAHLRSVLHHQGDRPGHRPRPVDHLRHRARARRRDRLRQHGRPGNALHGDAARRGATPVRWRPGSAPDGQHCRVLPRAAPRSILVVDDEEIMREILEALLTREGYQVRLASSGEEGLELARSTTFDAAIVDVMMPGLDGIATLQELRKLDDDLPVLMITAFASVETAIAAMKLGAFDYITKPFKNDEVLVVVRNAVERRQLVAENTALKQTLQAQYRRFAGIIGGSPRMKQVFDLIIQAAPSRSTILVTGESGTGKELVARAIHSNSPRAERGVRHGQFRQSPVRSARVHALRPREGRVHRRDQSEEGPVRSRRQGQHLLRRDRQHSAGDAGQAAARDAGAGVHAARRHGHDQGRRPHHRGHELRPASRWWKTDGSARISTTGCTSSTSSCRRCAIGRKTSRC